MAKVEHIRDLIASRCARLGGLSALRLLSLASAATPGRAGAAQAGFAPVVATNADTVTVPTPFSSLSQSKDACRMNEERMRRALATVCIGAIVAASGAAAGQTPAAPKSTPDLGGQIAAVERRVETLKPYARLPACHQKADETRWTKAGKPDRGKVRPLISAHRGGNTLAPENTLDAYEAALA
ncbi:MAG: hypothetical protein WCI21_09415, partial [Alphaproteobacteria bacterium]